MPTQVFLAHKHLEGVKTSRARRVRKIQIVPRDPEYINGVPGALGPQRLTDVDEDARSWQRPEPAAIRVPIEIAFGCDS